MKIKTRLYLGTLITVILLSSFLVSRVLLFNDIAQESQKLKLSAEVKTAVFELNILLNDYLLNRGERAEKQWEIRYLSTLTALQKAEEEEEETVKNIAGDYLLFSKLFNEEVENYKYEQKLIKDGYLREELSFVKLLREQKINQLIITSQKINSFAEILQDTAFKRLDKVYKLTKNSAYLFTLIILVIITFISIRVARSITKPIEQLMLAEKQIANKNFNTRVAIKTNDEFKQLGDSFNRTAQSLERVSAEERQIDKAKSEFLSITSHELRSPMTPMKGQLQMLLGDYFGKLTKPQRESLENVLRNTERLDKMIYDFLEISRIEAARLRFIFVKVDIRKHIHHLIQELNAYLPEKNININLKIGEIPHVIDCDPDKVMQVLRNLITNAKKFSSENSKIELNVIHKNNNLLFSVRDYGKGIPKESQQRIFEPFYQVDSVYSRKYGGSGLGLAICKGIVEAQEGKMWFESKGAGTTFYFTVPLVPVREIKPLKLISREESLEEREAKVTGREGVATGREAKVTGREGVATGREAKATGREAKVTGREGVATGREAKVTAREKISKKQTSKNKNLNNNKRAL